jgi:16S rRNA (cytidine1402-2'-O)-methyltransferase
LKNLELLASVAPNKKMIVGREITKMHEQIFEGSVSEVHAYFQERQDKIRGEFTLIVV